MLQLDRKPRNASESHALFAQTAKWRGPSAHREPRRTAERQYGAPYGQTITATEDGNPNITATISGFFNGDTGVVVHGTPTLTTNANTRSRPGSYVIKVHVNSLSAANFIFQAIDGQLTVTPAPSSLAPG
jgi:hypothetical protein